MSGDGKWRTEHVGSSTGARRYLLWRVVDGVVEYYRTPASSYAPMGRIIKYDYVGALTKAAQLNAAHE